MKDKYIHNNYGFIADTIAPEDYRFGAISSPILQENGQWDDFLPEVELQRKNGVETMACTSFGTLNCVETLLKRLFHIEDNYSERYTAILSGTTRNGNSPHKVAQTIRHFGLINEVDLPFDNSVVSWETFYTPNPMRSKFTRLGIGWLNEWSFEHEWVDKDYMKYALKFSPLGVSVFAWSQNVEGLYTKEGMDNHWCMCYGYKEGEFWKVFDHYDQTHKLLAWDYDFKFIKRYGIRHAPQRRWWIADIIRRLL